MSEKEKKLRDSIIERLKVIDLADLRIADAYASGMMAERSMSESKSNKKEKENE